ncbi:hypothetical protein [Nitrosomonas communis]|uniref:hypothetical protein n=1 Tax=Nitrosomonas communis TaxID=44574 RepID=UPI0015A5005D|nr:hypothetical protein [Nitrosomonas communis]
MCWQNHGVDAARGGYRSTRTAAAPGRAMARRSSRFSSTRLRFSFHLHQPGLSVV